MPTRSWIVLVCTALALAAGGCGKSPDGTAVQFVKDWDDGKFADAEKLMSKSAADQFEQTAQLAGGRDALFQLLEQARQADRSKAVSKVDVTLVTVIHDKAIAHYKTINAKGDADDEREMDLVKEGGEWKVNFDRFPPWARVPGVPRAGGNGWPGGGQGGRGGQGRGRRGAASQPAE